MKSIGSAFKFVVVLFAALLTSCGKSDHAVTDDVFFECKLNGELHTFNNLTNANDPPSEETVHFVVIAGWEGKDINKSPSFDIMLVSEENITEGTYHVAGGSSPELDGQYCLQIYEGETHLDTECFMGGRSSDTHFTLNITRIDDWGVKGTFSGLIRDVDDNYIEVTDGKFSAPYNIYMH